VYHIRTASPAEVTKFREASNVRKAIVAPKLDLSAKLPASLSAQRATDGSRYGAKSANLGEVLRAKLPQVVVPPGFTLPFSAYRSFVVANNLDPAIDAVLVSPSDGPTRRARLTELKKRFTDGEMPKEIADEIVSRVQNELQGKGVFVRSSTNSEDLPNFSGAGLYTTVPNVKGDDALISAVKTVWASV
jgi:phosphoenolpyruvate synthase/pyruvate phosphate dikinase